MIATKQLGISGSIPTTGSTLYTTPAGHRTIVKSIVVQSNHTAAQRVIFTVLSGAVNLFAFGVTVGASASATESVILQPWLVLSPGESLNIKGLLGTCQAIVSGAELLE